MNLGRGKNLMLGLGRPGSSLRCSLVVYLLNLANNHVLVQSVIGQHSKFSQIFASV